MNDLHPLQLRALIANHLEDELELNWFSNTIGRLQENIQLFFYANEDILISGTEVIHAIFHEIDSDIFVKIYKKNGTYAKKNEPIISLSGAAQSILKGHNLAFSFFSRMCGLATITQNIIQEVSQTQVKLLSLRQFTPGLKLIEKIAMSTGGVHNRTLFLKQGILITRHYLTIAGNLNYLINQLLETLPATIKIEVEVCHLDELQDTINAGVHSIILKNMSLLDIKAAVNLANKRVKLEAAGHFDLNNIKSIAKTGVDFISSDYIIHNYPKHTISSQIKKY